MLLVIAPEPGRRAALMRAAGVDATEAAPASVARAVRQSHPSTLVVEDEMAEATRSLLRRAGEAAERALPAVLMVSDGSAWLRGALPIEFQPCVAVTSTASVEVLSGALAGLTERSESALAAPAGHPPRRLTGVAGRRELHGSGGTARLTGF